MTRKEILGNTDIWDPSHRFETSWLLPPYVLFACRAIISLYAFVVLFFVLGWQCTHAEEGGCDASGNEFSYFTVLTYWGLAWYFLFASIHTFSYARWSKAPLDSWPWILRYLHGLFYTTVTTYPFLVTIVYWALLFGPSWFPRPFQAWSNISQHAMNSLFALFEIFIPRTDPSPWLHMAWLIVILALYLGLAYITFATKHFYVYSFLDAGKQKGLVAAYVFGIAVGIIIIFLIVKGLIWTRRWLTESRLHMDGKFANESSTTSWRRDDEHELQPQVAKP